MITEVGTVFAGVAWGWLLSHRSVPPPFALVAVAALGAEALALAGGAAAAGACAGSAAGAIGRVLAVGALARRVEAR